MGSFKGFFGRWVKPLFQKGIFLFTLLVFTAKAQEFPMQYFDVDDGLPTARVDHLRMLESGELFVGGRGTASIYDGYRFKELNPKIKSWYWFSAKDHDGTTWYVDASNCLTKIEDGRLVHHPAFENLLGNYMRGQHVCLTFDRNNTAYLGLQKSWTMLKADSTGKVDRIDLRDSFPPNSIFVDNRYTLSPIFGGTPSNKEFRNNLSLYVNGRRVHQTKANAIKIKCIRLGEKLLVSANRTLFIVDGQNVSEWKWDDTILTFFEDSEKRLWIGTNRGAYIASIDNKLVKKFS